METFKVVGCAVGMAATAALGGCATSSDSSESEEVEESATESTSSDSMSNVETVHSESKRHERERDRVSGVIEQHAGVLEACNLRSLAAEERSQPDEEITFGWSVGQNGRPQGVRVLDNELEGTGIARCVIGELRKMKFPPPESDTINVEYPIQFRKGETRGTGEWYERVHEAFRTSWKPPESMRPEESEGANEEAGADAADGEEEESDGPEIPDELRERVEKTVVFVDVNRSGEVESYEFLRRPGDQTFEATVEKGIEEMKGEGDGRWPMPRRSELRRRVASTGIILQNWLEPEDEEESEEEEDSEGDGEAGAAEPRTGLDR